MKQRAKLPRSGGSGTKKKTTSKQAKQAASPATEKVDHAQEHTKEDTTTTKDDDGTSVVGAATGDISEGSAAEEGKAEGEDKGDGSASRGALLQKHKQELRDLKNTRGKPKAELKKMERELRLRQQTELHEFDRQLAAQRAAAPKPPPKAAASSDEESDAEEPAETVPTQPSDEKQDAGPKKPSRQQRRRQKREAEERERERRIEEERKNAGPSARALETRRILEKLTPKGLRIVEVPSDGNCLYSAVADQVKRRALQAPQSGPELRRLTAEYILAHPDDFLPFLLAEEELPPGGLPKYCEELKRDGVWGGQLELRALAHSLKIPIVIHSADAPELTMGEEHNDKDPLQLSYHRHYYALGEHYNSVAAATE